MSKSYGCYVLMVLMLFIFSDAAEIYASEKNNTPVNFHTVLWRHNDLYRECWSDRDVAVLHARRLFQFILPQEPPTDIFDLISHFKMCLNVVRDVATSEKAHAIMVRSMADTIGGYLQSIGVPRANQQYYEGNLSYTKTFQVNELLRAIKNVLGTDGGGWTRSYRTTPSENIKPYEIPPTLPGENNCNELISTLDLKKKTVSDKLGAPKIPLPFLDNVEDPKSIAMPFKYKTLYSLFDKEANNVLLRYYEMATRCYEFICTNEKEKKLRLKEFDRGFHNWLATDVVPHLHDDVWYPAFGGVYQILKTLSLKGFEFPTATRGLRHKTHAAQYSTWLHENSFEDPPWFFVVTILGFLLLFWFVIFVISIAKRKYDKKFQSGTDEVVSYNYECGSTHSVGDENIAKFDCESVYATGSCDTCTPDEKKNAVDTQK